VSRQHIEICERSPTEKKETGGDKFDSVMAKNVHGPFGLSCGDKISHARKVAAQSGQVQRCGEGELCYADARQSAVTCLKRQSLQSCCLFSSSVAGAAQPPPWQSDTKDFELGRGCSVSWRMSRPRLLGIGNFDSAVAASGSCNLFLGVLVDAGLAGGEPAGDLTEIFGRGAANNWVELVRLPRARRGVDNAVADAAGLRGVQAPPLRGVILLGVFSPPLNARACVGATLGGNLGVATGVATLSKPRLQSLPAFASGDLPRLDALSSSRFRRSSREADREFGLRGVGDLFLGEKLE